MHYATVVAGANGWCSSADLLMLRSECTNVLSVMFRVFVPNPSNPSSGQAAVSYGQINVCSLDMCAFCLRVCAHAKCTRDCC